MRDVSTLGIAEMLSLLETGQVTSVDLGCASLNRIGFFDRTGQCRVAIPLLDPSALDDARSSDARRAAGTRVGRVDGISFTVKDSFKVGGITIAAGSPVFAHLVANGDATTSDSYALKGQYVLAKLTCRRWPRVEYSPACTASPTTGLSERGVWLWFLERCWRRDRGRIRNLRSSGGDTIFGALPRIQ